jgi:hypothetical protein
MAALETLMKAMGVDPTKLQEQFAERFGPQIKVFKEEYINTRQAFWNRHKKHDEDLAAILAIVTDIKSAMMSIQRDIAQSSINTAPAMEGPLDDEIARIVGSTNGFDGSHDDNPIGGSVGCGIGNSSSGGHA